MEALCLRLLDLARAQHAALAAGNLDEALTLMEKRQSVCEEIGRIGDGNVRQDAVRQVLSIDRAICGAVRDGIAEIRSRLDGMRGVSAYLKQAGPGGGTNLTC